MKNTKRSRIIKEWFFNEHFSIEEIFENINKDINNPVVSIDDIKSIISKEIKKRDKQKSRISDNKTFNFYEAIEKLKIKQKIKKEYIKLYEKAGFYTKREKERVFSYIS